MAWGKLEPGADNCRAGEPLTTLIIAPIRPPPPLAFLNSRSRPYNYPPAERCLWRENVKIKKDKNTSLAVLNFSFETFMEN